jgi:hypothetical protein
VSLAFATKSLIPSQYVPGPTVTFSPVTGTNSKPPLPLVTVPVYVPLESGPAAHVDSGLLFQMLESVPV